MELPGPLSERLLDTWPVARLATLGPDGAPHQVPIVFARRGATLYSPVDGKPKRGGELARLRNVRRDPRISLLLDHYDDDWTRLWWIRVDAVAQVVGTEGAEAAVTALRAKYPQYAEVPLFAGPPTLLSIEPLRVSGWCAASAALP